MILVLLGTQDKQFTRILKQIDKDIIDGNIKEEVIVQAGNTIYESANMEIFDLKPMEEINELIDKANVIITHGGVGFIVNSLNHNKKVIAIPRLKKYKEHTNDHQLQIVKDFEKKGYLIGLYDETKLLKALENIKTFKPNKYESDNSKMITLIDKYIEGLK